MLIMTIMALYNPQQDCRCARKICTKLGSTCQAARPDLVLLIRRATRQPSCELARLLLTQTANKDYDYLRRDNKLSTKRSESTGRK
jgi:hypothetical protein